MKMAKASEADIEMAMTLANVLDDIERGYFPTKFAHVDDDPDESEWLDTRDREQYERLIDGLKRLLNQGSIFRVVWGMAVICDPQNECIDPDADTIELHPKLVELEKHRAELLEVVHDAATSLETIQLRSFGVDSHLDSKEQMRAYAGARAKVARHQIAKFHGQPEKQAKNEHSDAC